MGSQDREFLGIDLGGTEIKAIRLTADGYVQWRYRTASRNAEGREAVLDALTATVQSGLASDPATEVCSAGFAIPGVLDPETGCIELLTNFSGDWTGFPLRDELARRTGLDITLINDVRAATRAEQLWGGGREYADFVCIAVGTGIGGGVVVGNQLYLGSRGAAGEIGHQTLEPDGPPCNCGNRGCLEALASGQAIERQARQAILAGDTSLAAAAGSVTPTPEQVACAAGAGHAGALDIYCRAGTAIGWALANVVCVLNPAAVVIGGGVAAAGEVLLQPIREELARRTVVFSPARGGVRLLVSPLGGWAGAIGAAAWALSSNSRVEGQV